MGLRDNTEIYLNVMETVVLPWIKLVVRHRPLLWQQDSAPCHVSNCSLAWLEEHCYDLVIKDKWPPSSPDLSPMDYFFWGVLENRTNRRPHIASIKEQCYSMDREMVKRDYRSFWNRIERFMEAEGNYVE